MCTVTFIARKNGYALGMNRDEKLSRVQALPPATHVLNGRKAIFPTEPSGGTWIGVNDASVTFALINWYSIQARVAHNVVSRGEVARSALAFADIRNLDDHLAGYPLKSTNPFRLIGIFPTLQAVVEWRWNLSSLERITHAWETNIWISSGFDERGAQSTRGQTFLKALKTTETDVTWLRKLHSSHAPSSGPYSICMHRHDAASVSYTEIAVDETSSRLAYVGSSPCRHQAENRAAPTEQLGNQQVIARRRD
jgi:hypothetical protein